MCDTHSEPPAVPPGDPVSAGWVEALTGDGAQREDSIARLHVLLVKIARSEALRRSGLNGIVGQELDDVACQAADDALLSILRRVTDFRGESKFMTWAYKFVIFEVSNKLSRHAWRRDSPQWDEASWELLPARLGAGPEEMAESRELVEVVRAAVDGELTVHQRRVFVAIVLEGMPLDSLVAELGTNRNAIYKTMFDARRKLHAHLITRGYVTSRLERDA